MSNDDRDPLAEVEVGDDDPVGAFDRDNICGATARTADEHNQMECVREPHPAHWVHVSACDDRVVYAWRDLDGIDLSQFILADDGVACRQCGNRLELSSAHFSDCPLAGESR